MDRSLDAPLITGIGLRLPGARGLGEAWQVLAEGRCTVTTVSPRGFNPSLYFDPQPGRRGKSYTFAAGQLDRLFHFDAGFFGISPREAAEMDPQQRLMLVSTWEAVEDAGLNMADLAGPRTGVFVGASIVENLSPFYFDTARGGSGFTLGNTLGIIANRVSAIFGFSGPSQVVDTACSSGLTALDMAVGALARDELDSAIVGAVHVIRAPGGFVGFSQARMLSPDGLCRAFDAGANGYVRSEASIALLLQRPEVADRMYARRRARILATGVNTDGAASPLVVPSAARQQALVDRALTACARDPDDFSFYEAHGTGTSVGDPAEAASISGGLACLRRKPLAIGSAKTNFGHAEPAAGLVGLVKTLLSMDRRALPASLHFTQPNPAIDFEELNLRVNNALTGLPDGRLVAGVNAFGFGGTNAVAIVESVTPVSRPRSGPPAAPPWLMLSAASEASLARLASNWADVLEDRPAQDHPALAAAAVRRAELPFRMVLPLDRGAAVALRDFANGARGAIRGRAPLNRPRTVFAFPGNGAQQAGMGQAEYRADAGYRSAFDAVAQAFAQQGLPNLAHLLNALDLEAQLRSPLVAQPLLVACQIAGAASLRAAGVEPAAVIGHSLGELTALHIAGVLDLQALARIVATRARAFEDLRGTGTMATLAASEEDVRRALSGLGHEDLCIAAVNGPRSVTVSGAAQALDRLARVTVAGRRLAMVRLAVDVPYHSAGLDPLKDQFLADVADVAFDAAVLPVASATLGRMMRPGDVGVDYLWRNSRDTVRFRDALAALGDGGPQHLVELSPRAILAGNIRDLARLEGLPLACFSVKDGQGMPARQIAAEAWVSGVTIDRTALAGLCNGPPPDLPTYPWDEAEHYAPLSPDGFDAWGEAGVQGLCGHRPDRDLPVWTAELTPSHPHWLADHRVGDRIVLPAALLAELVLSAGAQIWPDAGLELTSFDILSPVELAGEGVRLRTRLDVDTGAVTVQARPRLVVSDWSLVARGTLRKALRKRPNRLRSGAENAGGTDRLYTDLTTRGLSYGPAFRRLAGVSMSGKGKARAALSLTALKQPFTLDPTSLDAAFHALAAMVEDKGALRDAPAEMHAALADGAALLPVHIERLTVWQPTRAATQARLAIRRIRRRSLSIDLCLFAEDGSAVAQAEAAEFTVARLGGKAPVPVRVTKRKLRVGRAGPLASPRGWVQPVKALERLGFEKSRRPDHQAEMLEQLKAAQAAGKPTQQILARLLRDAPGLTDQARMCLAAQRGERLPEVARFAAFNRLAWDKAFAVLDDLLRRWPAQRCAVLLTGHPGHADVQRLAHDPRIDLLRLSDPEEAERQSLRRSLPSHLRPLVTDKPGGGFDVILGVGSVRGHSGNLAPGGIALHFDHGTELSEDARFDNSGPLPLRVRAMRSEAQAGATAPLPRLSLRGGLPPDLHEALRNCLVPDRPELALLPFVLRPGESADDALANALFAIRQALADASLPLCILAIDCGAAYEFSQFASGLAAAVATLANEASELHPRLVVCHRGVEPDWAEVFTLASEQPLLHIKADGIWTEALAALPSRPPQAPALSLAHMADRLEWRRSVRRRPRIGEVEVKVTATGLNFRDAMLARGLLPERILDGGASRAGLGMEFSGHVLRCGPGADLPEGSAVMGFAADGFATHLTLPAASVVPVPEGVSLIEAAGLPVAFVTAWEALVHTAKQSAGDLVLIHSGAGGVGLAAIQVARLHGARVFATASTPERRALALAAGAEVAFDSRNMGFRDAILAATGGRGVDIVLNSLSGAAAQRSVECLAPFGRFVELGKRDFVEGGRLDLRSFARQISYFAFDLDRLLAQDPDAVARTMAQVTAAFAVGRLTPLPVTPVPAVELDCAFSHALAGRHVGKLVVPPPVSRPARRVRPRPIGGAWVILGGHGGVGLSLAESLLGAGASKVHLLSRSGEIQTGNAGAAHWATSCDRVQSHAVDCADTEALGGFFQRLQADSGTPGGVVHAAMELRDRMLRDLDHGEAQQVIRAKLGVARALDQVLRAQQTQPDHVLFLSSLAAWVGNPGQTAYASANAGVEALAEARRSDGLPAQLLALGPIGDAGVLARHGGLAAHLARSGGVDLLQMKAVAGEVLKALQRPAADDYLYAGVDWAQLAGHLPVLGRAAFYRLVPEGAADMVSAGALAEELKSLDWPKALSRITQELTAILCRILRSAPDGFDLERPLGRYGIDSLMAMELRLDIEARLGLNLANLPFSADTTTRRFASVLLTKLRQDIDG